MSTKKPKAPPTMTILLQGSMDANRWHDLGCHQGAAFQYMRAKVKVTGSGGWDVNLFSVTPKAGEE